MKFASYRHDPSVPFAGGRTEPVSDDCNVAVIGAASPGLNAARTPPKQVQSEMPNLTLFSEVPAARERSFDDSAEPEQSN
jgi:hypothetical protein